MNTDLDMINPFLDPSFEIRWSELTPDRVKPAIETALAEAQERIDAIGENGALDFDNTFLALEEATEDLSLAWQKVSHLDTVCNSEPLREVHNEMLPKVTEFWARIPLNDKLWNILRRYAESEEGKVHTGVERRFIDETVADFRGHGADLPPDKKKRLEELSKELAEKTQKYSENVLDSTNAYELVIDDESLLDGLPDRSKEQARRDALEKGLRDGGEPEVAADPTDALQPTRHEAPAQRGHSKGIMAGFRSNRAFGRSRQHRIDLANSRPPRRESATPR